MRKKRLMHKSVQILFVFLSVMMMAQEGTKQVSSSSTTLSGLMFYPEGGYGSYYNSPDDNKIQFVINDHNTENFYFGFSWTDYGNTAQTLNGAVANFYYRILNSSGVQVVAPTRLGATTNGRITSYSQAIAGPNVIAPSTGYTPIVFNPTANGVYSIEYWRGTSATDFTMVQTLSVSPFFDFTVADSSGPKLGRVYATKWGLTGVRLSGGGYLTDIDAVASPSFYVYTDSNNILSLRFPSLQPLAYTVAVNKYGVADTNNFPIDRRSRNEMTGNVSTVAPALPGGYSVFLNVPDSAVFPHGTLQTGPPTFGALIVTPIAACNVAPYNINFTTTELADYRITISGSGYTSRIIDLYDKSAGNHVEIWDGRDGAGVLIAPETILNFTITKYADRFNIPIYDAEKNVGGIQVSTYAPAGMTTSNLFWNDSNLSAYPNSSTTNANGNSTAAGTNNSVTGTAAPAHTWAVSTTGTNYYQYFGNSRTINTWGYTYYQSSTATSSLLCSDVTITKIVNNTTPNIDDNVTFTLTAINNVSGTTAGNVVVNDVLPSGFELVAATPAVGTSWVAPNWSVGNLVYGTNKTLTITAKVLSSVNYTNIATISTANYETNYNNNAAYVKVTPRPMPEITITNVCPTNNIDIPPTEGVQLNDLHVGVVPAGASLVWFSNATHTGSPLASTFITSSGSYYAFYYDSVGNCYSPASAKVNILIQDCKCRRSPVIGTPDGYTKVGITTQSKTEAWPENVANGFIAMESTNKGFVITRTTSASVTSPIEGMLIYDTADHCFKLYNGTTWHCITQTCNE